MNNKKYYKIFLYPSIIILLFILWYNNNTVKYYDNALYKCTIDNYTFEYITFNIKDGKVVSFSDKLTIDRNYVIDDEINYLNDYIDKYSTRKLNEHILTNKRYGDCVVY